MSGICGMINFDGAQLEPSHLERMIEAASHRGPDGIGCWCMGPVGFAHLALYTTPESQGEYQPLVRAQQELLLTADVRLDNRQDLTETLTTKGHGGLEHVTDADLILAAYQCWDSDCAAHLIGDFAFAIWDAPKQRLFSRARRHGHAPALLPGRTETGVVCHGN